MGRPRKTLRPGDYEMISQLGSRGVTETDLARQLGLSFKTWRRVKQEDERAKAAYEEARAQERDILVGKLFQAAMDGNTVSAIFLLKSRHGYRDVGPVDGGPDTRVAVQVNIPAALSPAQYQALTHGKFAGETV